MKIRTLSTTAAAAAALALGAATPAQAAGSVDVRFVDPASYTDVGFGAGERERHLKTLEGHFQRLASRLPDGQTLQVDVLDVDLAGEVWPHRGNDYRVVRGNIDWPRMTLRYDLRGPDGVLKSGEQQIADMAFTSGLRSAVRYGGPLPYEQKLIERWFEDTFEDH